MNAHNLSPKESKTLAVLQITRIGDILQTAQAVRLLKINHPEYRVILIARKQFVEPIRFLCNQVFDKIISLDFKTSINLKDGYKGSLKNLQDQIQQINNETIHATVNLSFSKTSCYLHSLITSAHKIGPYFDVNHEKVIQDKWSQYLYASVMRGDMNPFNLVDLFANIIGVTKKRTHLTNVNYSKENKENIIIHPFASIEKKRWPESKWAEVIFKVLKDNPDVKCHIVGSTTDQEGLDKITNNPILEVSKNRITSHIGKSISDVYDLMDETFLFVGHDSMVGHLASFKNVKSITISLGTVRPQETAPYAINNYVLSPKTKCFPCFPDTACSFYQCHADVPYQTVINVTNQLLKANKIDLGDLTKKTTSFNLNPVEIHRTTIDKSGLLTFEDVLATKLEAKDTYRNFYKIIWSYVFGEVEINQKLPELSVNAQATLKNSIVNVEHLYELSEFGKKYSRYILEEISNKSPSLEKIKSYSQKIDEVDRLCEVLAKANPLLSPIVDYAQVAKNNLYGDNIVKMTESAFFIYQETSTIASIIYDFINKLNITDSHSSEATKQGKSI